MADRSHVLKELAFYADPEAMRQKYGIDITDEQIRLARKTLDYYKQIDTKVLRDMTDEQALRWPYRLTGLQRLDALMYTDPPGFSIPQSVIWKEVRELICKNADKYPDAKAVSQAIMDIEGFMQLNAYMGEFRENRDLMSNVDNKLLTLFAMGYANHTQT